MDPSPIKPGDFCWHTHDYTKTERTIVKVLAEGEGFISFWRTWEVSECGRPHRFETANWRLEKLSPIEILARFEELG